MLYNSKTECWSCRIRAIQEIFGLLSSVQIVLHNVLYCAEQFVESSFSFEPVKVREQNLFYCREPGQSLEFKKAFKSNRRQFISAGCSHM